MQLVSRGLTAIWKILLGAFMCHSPLTAFLVVGWTYRLMQRTALKHWWKLSNNEGDSFRSFTKDVPFFSSYETHPNWILQNKFLRSLSHRMREVHGVFSTCRVVLACMFGSLWQNGKTGVLGMMNIWVLTLLPSILWNFGWYSGWDNSFNKGYEQHDIGMTISFTGIALFIGGMFYLPMAQARQAVSGNWRSFYDFKTVWMVMRNRSVGTVFLACGYALISIPVMFFKTMPYFFEQAIPQTQSMTDMELYKFSNTYFFWTGLVFFLGYTLLRIAAARIYSAGLLAVLRDGILDEDQLAPFEMDVLTQLNLVDKKISRDETIVLKAARAVTRPAWRLSISVALVFIWFSFSAQIFVSEFINYHPVRGWMNQPLIQLPWYEYTPDHLKHQ